MGHFVKIHACLSLAAHRFAGVTYQTAAVGKFKLRLAIALQSGAGRRVYRLQDGFGVAYLFFGLIQVDRYKNVRVAGIDDAIYHRVERGGKAPGHLSGLLPDDKLFCPVEKV